VVGIALTHCGPNALGVRNCVIDDEGFIAPEPFRIPLIDNVNVELGYSDSAMVIRGEGRIIFQPTVSFAPTGNPSIDFRIPQNAFYTFCAGMRVVQQDVGTSTTLSGFDDIIADPLLNLDDYTDVRWKRLWWREDFASRRVTATLETMLPTAAIGPCNSVSAPSAGAPQNTLSNGSGTVNIPAITTDCCDSVCVSGAERPHSITVTAPPLRTFSLSMSMRKRFKLSGKQALVIDGNYTGGAIAFPLEDVGVDFSVMGQCRFLLEY